MKNIVISPTLCQQIQWIVYEGIRDIETTKERFALELKIDDDCISHWYEDRNSQLYVFSWDKCSKKGVQVTGYVFTDVAFDNIRATLKGEYFFFSERSGYSYRVSFTLQLGNDHWCYPRIKSERRVRGTVYRNKTNGPLTVKR